MSRAEVERQFDAIVEFAEVSKFLDTPMKHYSSGMYTRLAFSVASHLESEIMLVDEVLAVGDVEFQKKCLGKMGDIAKQGRTILFVSHNMGAVQQLCHRCVVLEKGKSVFVGKTDLAIGKYLERSHMGESRGNLKDRERGRNLSLRAKLQKINLNSDDSLMTIDSAKAFEIEFSFICKETVKTGYYLSIKDENRRPVLLLSSGHLQGKEFTLIKGRHEVGCLVEPTRLTSGRYSIDVGLLSPNKEVVDLVEDALFFNVTNSDPYQVGFDYSQQLGSFFVEHEWKEL
jgi:lipopolysaccharide transport system ATP-binding protein